MSFVEKVGGPKGGSGSFAQQVGAVKTGEELGFSDKLKLKEEYLTFLCQGFDPEGAPRFAYVAVNFQLVNDFIRQVEQDAWDQFGNYGVILLAGSGNPTDEQRQWMEEIHGFTHIDYRPLEKRRVLTLYRTYDARDRLCYYYMAVDENRYEAFQQAVASQQPLYADQWGEVLAKGLGDPTPEVMARMEAEHGFDHHKAFGAPSS